jgi:hypothetical protein
MPSSLLSFLFSFANNFSAPDAGTPRIKQRSRNDQTISTIILGQSKPSKADYEKGENIHLSSLKDGIMFPFKSSTQASFNAMR